MSLVTRDDPILREVMPEFTGEPRSLRPIAEEMFRELTIVRHADPRAAERGAPGVVGIGLAAPQIGQRLRMFVMNTKPAKLRTFASTYVCINPVVLGVRGEPKLGVESCLSELGKSYRMARHEDIRVEYTDLAGKVRRETLYGLAARCFLHQLDHLNGVTIWGPWRRVA